MFSFLRCTRDPWRLLLGLAIALAAATFGGAVCSAEAEEAAWPSRPIRLVVPFPAGGGVDINARQIAPLLSRSLGQPVVVENRPGAGGNLAVAAVMDAPPNGYTLLFANVGVLSINPFLYSMKDEPLKRLAPLSLVVKNPFVIWASATMPGEDWAGFVAAAKANPDAYNYASGGSGTSNHLCMELLKKASGIEMRHIPYKGGAAALNDLLAGRVHGYCDVYNVGAPYLAEKRIKALAVTSASRLPVLPQVPTLIELGLSDFEVSGWQGILAPAGTPTPIVERLSTEIRRAVESEEIRQSFAQQGSIASGTTPAQFKALIESETVRWGRIVKQTGARAD